MTNRCKNIWLYSGLIITVVSAVICTFMYCDILNNLNSDINNKKSKDVNKIIDDLKQNYIYPPSILPYNFSHPEISNPSHGQTQFVDKYFKNMTNGFFIESGAYDGERLSNTLFLERFRNWTGLLIEPNPSLFKLLINKHRKAYAINACISSKKYSSIEMFSLAKTATMGHVVQREHMSSLYTFIKVSCFPLISILQAINRFEIDYFSLDVEGAEKGILESLPWDKLNIRTISIEHNKWPGGKQALLKFMRSVGYIKLTEIRNVPVAPDFIFIKRDIKYTHE